MSEANVETVRRAWEAFARHDNHAIFPLYDPEVEIDDIRLGRIYRGFDGVREYFRDWLAVWDEYGHEVEEWIDAGDDVIAVMHWWGQGKQSGLRVEERTSHVWTLRDGKLWRLRIYATKADALKAVGMSG
jgi:ketosteroid isomerase-like protein